MVMTDPDAKRRWLSIALLLVIAALGALTFRYAGSTADTTSALEESEKISGCRASYRVALDDAQATASALFLRGLAASATDDDATLREIITPDADGLNQVDRALEAIDVAAATYGDAVALSRSDPDAFLAKCDDLP